MWSKRNVDHVTPLIETGRMRERGLMEIQRAKADGRWDRADEGAAAITVPPDLQAALAANPDAATAFERLSSAERYPILLKIVAAPTRILHRTTGSTSLHRPTPGVSTGQHNIPGVNALSQGCSRTFTLRPIAQAAAS